jgi:GNAT superfamily N-acetyltransferase
MRPSVALCSLQEIAPLRERYRAEMNCQITKDSIHRREGWTRSYLLKLGDIIVGYGAVAIAGPWQGKPTVIEFHLLPEYRPRAFELFDAFLTTSSARFLEIQSNAVLLTVMLFARSRDVASEKIVFHDGVTTTLPANGASFRRVTPLAEVKTCVEQRQGGGEWVLELDGAVVATGGILFHYNRPYGDIYMEVSEPFRRRGFGSYLVQELKRVCREDLASIPCARCDTGNIASRQTLQKAGFVPCAHMLTGALTA